MIEIDAINTTSGLRIIERFENGNRFYKITPKDKKLLILDQLKKVFKDKPVEIVQGGEWIMIKKLSSMNELEEEMKSKGIDEPTEEEMINQETKMLKNSGFIVVSRQI